MSGRAASGPRGIPYTPRPCPRCTGLGDAHYLTCPTLQVRQRQRCVYCGRWSYRPGWGCSNCGLCTVEDLAAHEPVTLLEASRVINQRLVKAAEEGAVRARGGGGVVAGGG